MKTKYTPAPWKIIEREILEDGSVYPRHIVGGVAEFQVCMMETTYAAKEAADKPDTFWATNQAKLGNSDLIAAAPELLEALKRIVDWQFRPMDSGLPTECGITAAQIHQAQDAINKAEGAPS